LRDEALVARILEAVVRAVPVPVTLKIRTGWAPAQRNGVHIGRLAEQAGIQALTVHGRTRACGFGPTVEYDTIAAIKAAVRIPVIANGDIDGPEKAREVLRHTGADAVMIGRAAQGRPWLFRVIAQYLATGRIPPDPELQEQRQILLTHLHRLYEFYGEHTGLLVARKHIAWYSKGLPGGTGVRQAVNQAATTAEQLQRVLLFMDAVQEQLALAA